MTPLDAAVLAFAAIIAIAAGAAIGAVWLVSETMKGEGE
jgi:hypothetical protein